MSRKRRRTKGAGGIRKRGKGWEIRYTVGGRDYSESAHTNDRAVAEKLLQQKLGEIAAGREVAPSKATIDDLAQLVLKDYELRGLRNKKHVVWTYNAHTKPILGTLLASRFGPAQVRIYIESRRKEGAKNGTINRELSFLRRGFQLGYEEDPPLVRRIPAISKLEENNVRQGFIEQTQYERLLGELPERLKALFVVGYHVGCRLSELRGLQWPQVDFEAGVIRLFASQTKGKVARTLPIYGEMEHWLTMQQAKPSTLGQWVFPGRLNRPVGAHVDGWREASERAGLPGLLFHDLRRSAVRNLTRAGVPRHVAMAITGHKTASVFARYDIVSEGDIVNVKKTMEEFMEAKRKPTKLERVK
jgi:integrase